MSEPLERLWQEHLREEFETKDVEATQGRVAAITMDAAVLRQVGLAAPSTSG
jgi:hypothetical protein